MAVTNTDLPVDQPFAKLLLHMQGSLAGLGIPPVISVEYSDQAKQLYRQAADLLGLDSPDSYYMARKVRHLDYCIRNSRFAAKATWRSCLAAVDALSPMIEDSIGLTEVQASTSLSYYLQTTQTLNKKLLYWRVAVTGTVPDLSVLVNDVVPQSWNTSSGPITVPVGSSGHSILFQTSASNGATVYLTGLLRLPYDDNLAHTYTSIKGNKDLVGQLTYNKPEYIAAINDGDSVEDAIAAFILAVNEI